MKKITSIMTTGLLLCTPYTHTIAQELIALESCLANLSKNLIVEEKNTDKDPKKLFFEKLNNLNLKKIQEKTLRIKISALESLIRWNKTANRFVINYPPSNISQTNKKMLEQTKDIATFIKKNKKNLLNKELVKLSKQLLKEIAQSAAFKKSKIKNKKEKEVLEKIEKNIANGFNNLRKKLTAKEEIELLKNCFTKELNSQLEIMITGVPEATLKESFKKELESNRKKLEKLAEKINNLAITPIPEKLKHSFPFCADNYTLSDWQWDSIEHKTRSMITIGEIIPDFMLITDKEVQPLLNEIQKSHDEIFNDTYSKALKQASLK